MIIILKLILVELAQKEKSSCK